MDGSGQDVEIDAVERSRRAILDRQAAQPKECDAGQASSARAGSVVAGSRRSRTLPGPRLPAYASVPRSEKISRTGWEPAHPLYTRRGGKEGVDGLGCPFPRARRGGSLCRDLFGLPARGHAGARGQRAGPRGSGAALQGLGDQHHHAITTRSPDAQLYFDQGLRLIYAFNHDEATRAFQECARIDAEAAMCFWGVALAAGPNYNSPIDPERDARAFHAIQQAKTLSPKATPAEQDYIATLSLRYASEAPTARQALDQAYADAMRAMAKRHPDDLDAQTLFAESMMDLRPWDLWSNEGEPRPGTLEVVATLEGVLRRDPGHPGANHYYIHAVEASKQPERGIPSAGRLGALAPAAGHLVHMPAHIYMRVGNYEAATIANEKAIVADQEYLAAVKPAGEYPMLYVPHNIDFLWAAACMDGQSAKAMDAARQLTTSAAPEMMRQMPMMEGVGAAPLFVMARFGQWDAILAEPAPPQDLAFWTALWHYARGLSYTRKGRLEPAQVELALVRQAAASMPADRVIMQVNSARTLLEVASHDLAGEIAAQQGRIDLAVEELRQAVKLQDGLRYMEPPPWYLPERQALGAVLLKAGRAKEAEAVYLQDLARNPENAWSLRGLEQSLRAQKKTKQAEAAQARLAKASARADVKLISSRF
jgi:tetratricopeptide (TPR) repeat protein